MTTAGASPAPVDPPPGALRFDEFMERALYDPVTGFYERGGRAGRRGGAFVTSPEVGPLFGAVIARLLDIEWDRQGRPPRFTFVDAGAGPGTLARTVLAARPRCLEALEYVAVEVTAAQRRLHPAGVVSRPDLPPGPLDGIILANELLDNLPTRIAVGDHGELWVREGREVVVGDDPGAPRWPRAEAAARWVVDALGRIRRGRLVVIDYMSTTAEMRRHPWRRWVRTYAGHAPAGDPLADPGSRDITVEVPVDQLVAAAGSPAVHTTQARWLVSLGLEELVAEGRRRWEAAARAPDVAALMARSRITEAPALTAVPGLGAHTVLEWHRG